MRKYFSSSSSIALATAAILAFPLALPMSAGAAEVFAYRDGQKVAASLEMPATGAELNVAQGSAEQVGINAAAGNTAAILKTGAGQLILSGESLITNQVTISAGSINLRGRLTAPVSIASGAFIVSKDGTASKATVSATGSLIVNGYVDKVTSEGMVINNDSIFQLVMNGGTTTNNEGAFMSSATVNAGQMVNNGGVRGVNVAAGAGFVNNSSGRVTSLSNYGISSNNGNINRVGQEGGSFANGDNGQIFFLRQAAASPQMMAR